MNRLAIILVATVMALCAEAQESQTVFNFLRLPVSAHVAALGGDNITLSDDDATLTFHNPALANNVSDKTLNLNMMTYMQGAFTGSASFLRAAGERGTWAASARFVSYGTMKETNVAGEQTGTFSAKDIAVGATYAYALSNYFAGGITAKFVGSYIGRYNSLGACDDIGLNYYHAATEWSVSAVARNLGGQLTAYDDDFERMPLDVQLGVSKRFVGSPLRLSFTMVRLNDWEYGLGRHFVLGLDVLLGQTVYFSAGYNALRASEMKISSADNGSSAHGAALSFGGGLTLEKFKLHLAYARYHVSSTSLLLNLSYSL